MWHGPHRKRRAQQFFYCWMCICCPVTFSPSRGLATNGGYAYRHTEWWEGFMKYAVEMGSGAIIYIPSFVKIGSCSRKLMGRGGVHRHRQYGDLISLFSFFENKESMLIKINSVTQNSAIQKLPCILSTSLSSMLYHDRISANSSLWALFEKPSVVQLLKNFPTFYGTRRFIAMFTTALYWSLCWVRSIQSTPPHPI
jgi:hypothetical protein